MDPTYRESRPILPRELTMALAAILIATVAFMAIMVLFMDTAMPEWTLPVTAVIFALIIVGAWVMKFDLSIYEDRLEIVYMFRRVEIPMSDIIDSRMGDLTVIKNYSNWSLKGVKHKLYSCIGDDMGVAMKLLGKRVVVVSSKTPEDFFGLIPKDNGGE